MASRSPRRFASPRRSSAALDRVTHAYLVDGVPPLTLSARADIALRLAGDDLGAHACDLLE